MGKNIDLVIEVMTNRDYFNLTTLILGKKMSPLTISHSRLPLEKGEAVVLKYRDKQIANIDQIVKSLRSRFGQSSNLVKIRKTLGGM